jgi:hypothetical protein
VLRYALRGVEHHYREPDEDERDPATERDEEELEAVVEQFGGFLPEVLDKLERACVEQAFTLWAGYAAFCDESVGVAAEKIAAVVLEPVMGRKEDMKVRAERLGVETDEDTVEEMRESLAESWRVIEERGV